jgi:hypothetical protein
MLGAFAAAILVGELQIPTRRIDEQLRGLVVALFMAIFFSPVGLHADFTILRNSTLFFLTICPCRKSDPNILMMQSAENWHHWHRKNAPDGLNGARYWRVLVQSEMCPSAIKIFHI